MFGLKLKVIRHIKKQKNTNPNKKKNVSTATNSELIQKDKTLRRERDLKVAIIFFKNNFLEVNLLN